MRTIISLFLVVGLVPLLSSCGKFAFGGSSEKSHWINNRSLLGIIILKEGTTYQGEMYLLNDGLQRLSEEDLKAKPELASAGMPLCSGVHDKENGMMLFPIRKNTMVQANSARLLRKNKSPYVEITLADLSRPILKARWRIGSKKPSMVREFLRLGGTETE